MELWLWNRIPHPDTCITASVSGSWVALASYPSNPPPLPPAQKEENHHPCLILGQESRYHNDCSEGLKETSPDSKRQVDKEQESFQWGDIRFPPMK